MAKKETLGAYLNRNIEEKGSTLSKEKAKGKKYKSISAAKKAGSLYYTNKAGKIMAAVYAEDLKVRPKAKPGGSAVSPRAGVGGGVFAGKGAGKDKPKAKARAGDQDKGDSYDALMKKKRDANARTSAARVLEKDNIERGSVAVITPATATNQDPNQNKTGRLSPRLLELQRKRREKQAAAKKNKGGPVSKKPKGAYAAGGMPMVMKGGTKVPAFAADGKGKMNKGGMAKKKPAAKMMAGGMAKKSGYMYGGMAKKKK